MIASYPFKRLPAVCEFLHVTIDLTTQPKPSRKRLREEPAPAPFCNSRPKPAPGNLLRAIIAGFKTQPMAGWFSHDPNDALRASTAGGWSSRFPKAAGMNKKGRDEAPCLPVLSGFPRCRYACIRETLRESRKLPVLKNNLWRLKDLSSQPSRGFLHKC